MVTIVHYDPSIIKMMFFWNWLDGSDGMSACFTSIQTLKQTLSTYVQSLLWLPESVIQAVREWDGQWQKECWGLVAQPGFRFIRDFVHTIE